METDWFYDFRSRQWYYASIRAAGKKWLKINLYVGWIKRKKNAKGNEIDKLVMNINKKMKFYNFFKCFFFSHIFNMLDFLNY